MTPLIWLPRFFIHNVFLSFIKHLPPSLDPIEMTRRTDAIASKKKSTTRTDSQRNHPFRRQQPTRAVNNASAAPAPHVVSTAPIPAAAAAPTAVPTTVGAAVGGQAVVPPTPFPYPDKLQPTRRVGKRSFVVVGIPKLAALRIITSVLYLTRFYCELVYDLTEARRAQANGGPPFDEKFPGIPDRKFTRTDLYPAGKKWQVQAFYERKGLSNAWTVLFEGWDCLFMGPTRNRSHEEAKACAMRTKFLKSLATVFLPNMKNSIQKARYLYDDNGDYRTEPKHMFWRYEDLSFYHSEIQLEQEMAKIFYFCFLPDVTVPPPTNVPPPTMVKPPTFHYSALNVIEAEALEYCYGLDANKSYAELSGGQQWVRRTNNGVCENSRYCKCNARFEHLYASKNASNLQPRHNGTLDMNLVRRDDYKIVVECSDECGCSLNCPRRQLQKGQTKALAVVYENEDKGFGLRAVESIKSGELICEYAGYVYCPRHKSTSYMDEKDTSYEATFEVMNGKEVVIDSIHIGNVSRFANHKCSPNSMFIEVESRKSVSEPLIPRIALYATEDIEIGEEITVAYFDVGVVNDVGTVKCECGCDPCIGYFPFLD